MRIGVPDDGGPLVPATPATTGRLVGLGYEVAVAAGAGARAGFPDAAYVAAGAAVVPDAEAWAADVVVATRAPDDLTAPGPAALRPGAVLVAQVAPAARPDLVRALADRGVTALALDSVPRISRAQSLDVLSALSNVAGYRAVVEAAAEFGGMFAGQVTAAGTTPPANVFVIGAGVAGLAAIGAAGSLGAQVRAFDVRPEVADHRGAHGLDLLAHLGPHVEGAHAGAHAAGRPDRREPGHARADHEHPGRRRLARGGDLAGEHPAVRLGRLDHRAVAGDVGHRAQHVERLRAGDARNRVERERRHSPRVQGVDEVRRRRRRQHRDERGARAHGRDLVVGRRVDLGDDVARPDVVRRPHRRPGSLVGLGSERRSVTGPTLDDDVIAEAHKLSERRRGGCDTCLPCIGLAGHSDEHRDFRLLVTRTFDRPNARP